MKPSQAINIDVEKISLEKERLALDARRLSFEHSFPRKWGPLVIGFLLPLTTWLGGIQFSEWEKTKQTAVSARAANEQAAIADRERAQQSAEKDRQTARLEKEKETSSARSTLELYFKHFDLMDPSKPLAIENLSMLAEISGLESIRAILRNMADRIIVADRDFSRRSGRDPRSPAELLQGVPDLFKPKIGSENAYSDLSKFTAYVQAPAARREDLSIKSTLGNVRGVLKGLGLRAPDTEFVKSVPNENEIRIYLPEHRPFAENMARKLAIETGESFAVKEISKSGLPDGVLEIWMRD